MVDLWLERIFMPTITSYQALVQLLAHRIVITLSQVEDGGVYVSKYKMIPVLVGGPARFAFSSAGAILSGIPSCPDASYRRELYRFILTKVLGTEIALELPEGSQIASRDVISFSSDLSFIGSTYWTNEEAIRAVLAANIIKSKRVAVVRDLFDRHLRQRPHLDNVFFPLTSSIFAVSEVVLGKSNTKRRLVQEYTLGEDGTYSLSVNDMELGEYLEFNGFTVLPVPASEDFVSLALVSLGNNKFIGYNGQKSLIDLYKQKANIEADLVEMEAHFAGNVFALHDFTPMFANVVPNPRAKEVPLLHQPITAYGDARPRQTSNKLLMVAPIGFLSNAQTALDNYFMNKTNLPEYEVERRALGEYSDFHRALTAEGVRISLYRNERFYEAPDAVFPNNWFSTHSPAEHPNAEAPKSSLFFYPMKAPARRAERREHIVTDLMDKYEDVENLSYFEYRGTHGVAFEGTGCLVLDRVHKVAYCALSQRADEHVFRLWCTQLGYEPCVFEALDSQGRPVYHTNVVMGIGSSVAVVCLESVANAEQRDHLRVSLQKHHAVIDITYAQMHSFCGNVLEVQGANDSRLFVMSSRAHAAFTPDQLDIIARHVTKIVHVPVPTIEDIGGGGVRCMMGELF
jgi:hypothetical protein